jgi:ATP-dependent RNA helicase SUPV3L1/SUV3
VGRLDGLMFFPVAAEESLAGRALRNAALKALKPVIERRLGAIAAADDTAFSFDADTASIVHECSPVARLVAGADWFDPQIELVGARHAHAPAREAAHARLARWFDSYSRSILQPLHELRTTLDSDALKGAARGAAYQLLESGAAFDRRATTQTRPAPSLSAEDRAALHAAGARLGRVAAWLPGLLKPAPARLALALRAVHSGQPTRPAPSQSSFPLNGTTWPETVLWTAGYLRLGPRAVRADLAERLIHALGLIRRGSETSAFAAPPELAAQIGCPIGEFHAVLRSLGLKPAEKDESGEVKLWRFAANRPPRPRDTSNPAPPPTGPFAALAGLVAPSAAQPRRRRRKPRAAKPAVPKAAM